MSKRLAIIPLVLLLLAALPLSGQRRARPGPPSERQSFFALQLVNLIADDSSLSRLDILYDVPRSFFVLVRDDSSHEPDAMTGHGEINVEIFDRNRTSVARNFVKLDLHGKSTAPGAAPGDAVREEPDTGNVAGIFSFNLRPDEYTLTFEVRDHESDRHIADDSHRILLRDFRKPRTVSDIVFVSPSSDLRGKKVRALELGGDIPFGRRGSAFFEISSLCPGGSFSGSYTITSPDAESHGVKTWMHDTLSPGLFAALRRPDFLHRQDGGNGVHTSEALYALADSTDHRGSMCLFTMDTDTLPQGRYELEVAVRTCDSTVTARSNFGLRWTGMPLSLRSLEFAIEPMRYILPEQEFDHLRSASQAEQRKLFDAFWRKKDPTPATAYNEVLEEFYRRVDHAVVEFRTLRDENGMKTDRGKAYILYGPASRVERDLSPSGPPRETWYYDRLQKKLIFEDETKKGDYVLISTDTL